MMKNTIFALLLAAACVPLAADPLEDLAGAERAARLAAGETIVEVQLKEPRPVLIPRHQGLRRLVDGVMEELGPGLFVESLYRYEKPAGASESRWTGDERLRLYNEVLALSSLAGITYYSASRKTMRTFYEYSRVIEGPGAKQALPDPVFSEIPGELRIYARQKDLTFGDNIYQYDYFAGADSLIFVQQNLTAMNAGIIPAVGKNRLRSVVAVIDAGDSLLIYAVSMARAVSLPGLGERIGNSFTNRAEAILKWFAGRADRAFGNHG
ncbi:MAG: hypothetical protein LBK27_04455 [Treponema sp.]|jgi:hypothetical protein|nr:hypothetical protein [Treponema sp.]